MDSQTTNQDSSMKVWYLIAAVVIIALGFWYFYGTRAPISGVQPATTEQTQSQTQTQSPSLSTGDTTADISADLEQTVDNGAALDQDAAASIQEVQGF